MKRVRTLLVRVIIGTVLLLSLSASVASADPGASSGSDRGSTQFVLPEDPGLE